VLLSADSTLPALFDTPLGLGLGSCALDILFGTPPLDVRVGLLVS
jgi:hypothetical protein